MTRPKFWQALLVALALSAFWELGPQQLARVAYVTFWTIAPQPVGGGQHVPPPDRFLDPASTLKDMQARENPAN